MPFNKAQLRALVELWQRSPSARIEHGGSFLRFRRSCRLAFGGECLMVRWCGMTVGIERDGYTHS